MHDLASLLRLAELPASLLASFEDEELTVTLLRSMAHANLMANLGELGLSQSEALRLAAQLHTEPAPSPLQSLPLSQHAQPGQQKY